MNKINQFSATFIQEKKKRRRKKSVCQKVMLYCQGEIFREKSIRNSRVPEIVFMCSGNLTNEFINKEKRTAEDLNPGTDNVE